MHLVVIYFYLVKEDFLHKIDLEALKKEVNMNVDEIGALANLKNSNGVYKWAKSSENDGTRPSYNTIIRLIEKGATQKTLFGVDQKQHSQAQSNQQNAIDYKDPSFLETVKNAMLYIEACKNSK